MKKKNNIGDELESLSPFLSEKMKEREGGFKVPDGYFERLTDQIMNGVREEGESATVRSISSAKFNKKRNPIRWIAAAASMLLLIAAGFWMMNNTTSIPEGNQWAELESYNEEQILKYLDDNTAEFDLDDLVESGMVGYSELGYNAVDQLSDEEAVDYLDVILDEISDDI